MSHLHDPTNPRHARMFELLRQGEQAAYTTDRLQITAVRHLDDHTAEKIRETALKSLRISDFAQKRH